MLNNHIRDLKMLIIVIVGVDTGIEGSGDEGGDAPGGSQMVSLDIFRECSDRVMMPCDSEEFITVGIFITRYTYNI